MDNNLDDNSLSDRVIEKMISLAKVVRKNAYTNSIGMGSKFGSCVLSKNNNYYVGCNVQTHISGLGTCAERNAIESMISAGDTKIKAVCVVSSKKAYPCGMCLQFMANFMHENDDIIIIISSPKNSYELTSFKKILPHAYYHK
jgi:cytidine deaminase